MASSHTTYEKVATNDLECAPPPKTSPNLSAHSARHSLLSKLVIHLAVLSIYTAILLSALRFKVHVGGMSCSLSTSETSVFSPAREALPLRVEVNQKDVRGEYPDSPFTGNPGTETDSAWRHLLRGEDHRASATCAAALWSSIRGQMTKTC